MKSSFLNWHLQPADRIVVPKSKIGWVQHHAIYLGMDDNNIDWIAENKVGKGLQFVTATEFFKTVIEIKRVEPFIGTEKEREKAVLHALALKGKNYNLLHFNCEHYANLVQHNQLVSYQANTGLVLGFVVFTGVGILLHKD